MCVSAAVKCYYPPIAFPLWFTLCSAKRKGVTSSWLWTSILPSKARLCAAPVNNVTYASAAVWQPCMQLLMLGFKLIVRHTHNSSFISYKITYITITIQSILFLLWLSVSHTYTYFYPLFAFHSLFSLDSMRSIQAAVTYQWRLPAMALIHDRWRSTPVKHQRDIYWTHTHPTSGLLVKIHILNILIHQLSPCCRCVYENEIKSPLFPNEP